MSLKLKILVSGMIAGVPYQGGASWAVLQYILGFQRLGHQVFFLEPLFTSQYQPRTVALQDTRNARYFQEVADHFELWDSAALVDYDSMDAVGLRFSEVLKITDSSDVLINLAGTLPVKYCHRVPIRVYLDLDPAFTQLWSQVQGLDMNFEGHSHFFTVGQAIGQSSCSIPTCGLDWNTTLQPVVLDQWKPGPASEGSAYTSIANWRSYGSIQYGDYFYGQKAHSWRLLMDLPRQTGRRFVIALSIHPEETRDLKALTESGWVLVDSFESAGTPEAYREFIAASKAELSIAKSGYVISQCGWFSERSGCYLASGRPVLAQGTGFEKFLPCGEGLFAFGNPAEVLTALDELESDYSRHSRRAREIAEEFLDSDRILSGILGRIGATG